MIDRVVALLSRSYIFARLAAFLLWTVPATSGIAAAKDTFAPPEGVGPTSATLATVVSEALAADGYANPPTTRTEEGTVAAWGLKGTFRIVEQGADFKSTTDLRDVSFQVGRNGGQFWRKNENGLVTLYSDETAFANASGVVDAKRLDKADSTLLGETADPGASYVVEVKPQHGRLHWAFVDKHSHLITRIEVPYKDRRVTWTFSDFRKTGSYTDAWREQFSDGISQNAVEYATTSERYNADLASAELAVPDTNRNLVQFPAGTNEVNLPAKIVSTQGSVHLIDVPNESHDITRPGNMSTSYMVQGAANPHILVNVTIDGQGYDFYLDSGAAGIFINSDVAKKLGLKMFGPVRHSPYGDWVPSYVAVPQMRVGDLTMTNFIAYSLPSYNADSIGGLPVVGLIGYDFLANEVTTIDYAKNSVVALNPFFFVPPAAATAIPATIDEGVPFISVDVGQSSSGHFILDTGATNCFLSKAFAAAHTDAIKDQGGGVNVNRFWLPEFGFEGVSPLPQELQVQATEVKTLGIAGITLSEWLMFRFVNDPYEDFDQDGIIGYDFLKHFTVYLDYPLNEVFLLPNASDFGASR